jgi:hypothetical protein
MRYPGFVGPAYRSASKIAAADQLVNLFPEKVESGTGKSPYVLYSAPGFQPWCTLGVVHTIRGLFTLNGAAYAVAHDTLYLLPSVIGGSATALATGINNPDDSIVSIAGNGDGGFQLVIASAGTLWCYDLTAHTLTQIPDIAGSFVVFQDGYFIALDPTTNQIHLSGLNDGSTWDPLDTQQRSDQPDKWLSLLLTRGEVWLPGSQSGSVYYDSGAPDFPFSQNPSGKLTTGILAPRAAQIVDGDPIWIQQNPAGGAMVVRFTGYSPVRISTHAIEYALSTYGFTALTGADAFVMQDRGHTFYVLTVPGYATWVYDATSGLWHQRGAWTGEDFGVIPVRTYAYAFGAHLVGAREATGIIWQTSPDVFTDVDGTGLRRRRRAPHLYDEQTIVSYQRLWLDADVGIGLASGQGSDPQGLLSWSNDGAQTFGNVYTSGFGAVGAYGTRVFWGPLGAGRDRVFQFDYSEPTALTLVDAYLRVVGGTS